MNSRPASRADDERPPGALLITSPYDIEARYSRKRSTDWTGYKVHFTEMCEDDEPHFIVEVMVTDATTPDGSILQELHEDEAVHELLPHQHLMDMGYVDAEVLAESQRRYQVEIVGPVISDTSWASQAADRFDHSDFHIDWQAKRVLCPAGQTSQDWGISLTGTASQNFGSDFRSRFAERVRFRLTVPKLGRKC